MAKSVQDIISGLIEPPLSNNLKALHERVDGLNDPKTIREIFSEELFNNRANAPYTLAELDIIYQAACDLTRYYPLNAKDENEHLLCPISHECITFDDTLPTQNIPYVFSVVSGHIYEREYIKKCLSEKQQDPITQQPYSPYELQRIGVSVQQPSDSQREVNLVPFELENLGRDRVSTASIFIYSAIMAIGNGFEANGLARFLGGGNDAAANVEMITTASCLLVILASLQVVYRNRALAEAAATQEDRANYVYNAHRAGMMLKMTCVAPSFIMFYIMMFANASSTLADAAKSNMKDSEAVGAVVGAIYTIFLCSIVFQTRLKLALANEPEQATVRLKKQAELCLVLPAVTSMLGIFLALIITGEKISDNDIKHGSGYGLLAGVMMSIALSMQHVVSDLAQPIVRNTLQWWRGRRGEEQHDDSRNIPLLQMA